MSPLMNAWVVREPGPIDTHPLELVQREIPSVADDEVLVRVEACGVCRTDLHLAEGDLPPHRPLTAPGHEVVGRVVDVGRAVSDRARRGQRVGVAWLAQTCGVCEYCQSGRENLCLRPTFTGWDIDGGYADYVVAKADFVYPLPTSANAAELAPLLCAGIVGYRALRRAEVPPQGKLGIYGFGASAHLVAQLAIGQGSSVHVFTRAKDARDLARSLGAASVQGATDAAPVRLDAAILFAPAGELVLPALEALGRGGTLAIAGIHLSDIPSLNYERHLFEERSLRSVTANTRADGRTFLRLAERYHVRPTVSTYPMARANEALADLAHDRIVGAAVLLHDASAMGMASST